jgi:uncharacterized small protein (DUF1192 family)
MREYRARKQSARQDAKRALSTLDQMQANRIAELEAEVRRLEAELAKRVPGLAAHALDRPAIGRGFGRPRPAPKPGK